MSHKATDSASTLTGLATQPKSSTTHSKAWRKKRKRKKKRTKTRHSARRAKHVNKSRQTTKPIQEQITQDRRRKSKNNV